MKLKIMNQDAKCWDAGDAGCGRLIMGLQREVGKLKAGEVLKVTASDPAARIDLPCWCHLTGHSLVVDSHPLYVLRKSSSAT